MNEQSWIDPNCTRTGWPAGPWDSETDKLQWTDEATGIVCLAKRHPRSGHWCGYVGVEPGHPWHEKGYEDIDCSVHYGLTYADACQEGDPNQTICHIPEPGKPEHLWWLGFDCAHCDDYSPQDAAWARDRGYPFTLLPDSSYKTLDWVREETARLARQARAADTSSEAP
jgi:hypothetical protein